MAEQHADQQQTVDHQPVSGQSSKQVPATTGVRTEPTGPSQPGTRQPDHLPQEQARDWALAAHLGSFLAAYVGLGFLCPLVVLLAKGKASAYVRHHAVESLNFQLTALGAGIIAVVLAFVYVGLILLPFIVMADVTLVVMAGLAARKGEWYRYPVSIRVIS